MTCMSQKKSIAMGCIPSGKIPTSVTQFAKGGMVSKTTKKGCK